MQILKHINIHKYNPSYHKHNLNRFLDTFITLFRMFFIALRSPLNFVKQFSFLRIKILIRAIRYEKPSQISGNFKHLLRHSNQPLPQESYTEISKEDYVADATKELDLFLKKTSVLDFNNKQPQLSVILVLYNKAELTYRCLKSLLEQNSLPIQLIIVDNCSKDKTSELLSRIKGADIIYNQENFHFIKACNQALEITKCPYVLFLNNDVEILDEAFESALNTLKESPKHGAVGAKTIGFDGKILEAGSIIWSDGSCLGYGRDQSPHDYNFQFKRVVDYCSGSFLLTRTELLKKHGGFDLQFMPAYYEEADYCMWLQKKGYKCIYDSKTIIRHFEFGSSDKEAATKLQSINQSKFVNKHIDCLGNHYPSTNLNVNEARFSASQKHCKKILYIDDRVPHRSTGSGFTRSNTILNSLQELGYQISVFPMYRQFQEEWSQVYTDISPYIEVVKDGEYLNFKEFIKSREEYYDMIWVSRPHNMDYTLKQIQRHAKSAKIIYDAEAIFAERMKLDLKLKGIPISNSSIFNQTKKELNLALKANLTITVSEEDASKFRSLSVHHTKVLGHQLKVRKSDSSFDQRKDLLFVGNLDIDHSPNVDSIKWFIKDIFPKIQEVIPEIKLHIIGSNQAKSLADLETKEILFYGKLEHIEDFYDQQRVFIAPTRFAAGIPYKIHEAAANGIPAVASQLLGYQLNWTHNKEIVLSGIDAQEFADSVISLYKNKALWEQVQNDAYQEVENSLGEKAYKDQLSEILNYCINEC